MKSKKRSTGQYICFVIFVIVALINIYPLVFSIFCSFKGNLEIFSSFTSLPKRLRFENYVTAWKVGNIGRYFSRNTGNCRTFWRNGIICSCKIQISWKIKNISVIYIGNDDSYSGSIDSIVIHIWKIRDNE